MKDLITWSSLISKLSYNKHTGDFRWKINNGKCRKNSLAGHIDNYGYRRITINNNVYMAHKLAWFYHYKTWPKLLDHIDRNPDNNSIFNLRECTQSQNQMNRGVQSNNTLGVKGVKLNKKGDKYIASITKDYQYYHLGTFDNIEEADLAYHTKAKEIFGEFYNGL